MRYPDRHLPGHGVLELGSQTVMFYHDRVTVMTTRIGHRSNAFGPPLLGFNPLLRHKQVFAQ
jgi:hypothetical protein